MHMLECVCARKILISIHNFKSIYELQVHNFLYEKSKIK